MFFEVTLTIYSKPVLCTRLCCNSHSSHDSDAFRHSVVPCSIEMSLDVNKPEDGRIYFYRGGSIDHFFEVPWMIVGLLDDA